MSHKNPSSSALELSLRAKYGELLSTSDVAHVLRYGSAQAVRKARLRGTLAVPMQQLPGRRGWFTTARSVAAYLDQLDAAHAEGQEVNLERP